MADDPKNIPVAGPSLAPEEIAVALKEHDEASDRVRVFKKFPWLAAELNKRANQPKTK